MTEDRIIVKRVAWNKIVHGVDQLHYQISRGQFKPVGIVAVARGGLVPATILAHRLKLHKIISIGLSSHKDGEMQGGEVVRYTDLPEAILLEQGQGWLVVDDIVDSANTMTYMRKLLPKAKTACLFQQIQAPLCDFWWYKVTGRNIWIKFPWEQTL